MTPGQHMRRARRAAGLRMVDLARLSGVSYATIQSMESDLRNPSLVSVECCADALGISIDTYIGHEIIKRTEEP